MGTDHQAEFQDDAEVLEMDGDGCTIVLVYLMALNCTGNG